eukprot:m.60756 g.60756  ORF g.60756 m.60756 type:complete len:440 (-) comp22881_c1_seq1:146-1465(-)
MNESPGSSRPITESTVRSIIIDSEKCACVYDVIHMVTGAKDAAKRMQFKRIPENLKSRCKRWQFPGERQKEVAVASLDTMVGIIWALPGERAKKLRQKCIKIVEKILNGPDTTSSEEEEPHTIKLQCTISNEETNKLDTMVEVTTVQLPLDINDTKSKNNNSVRGKPNVRTKSREPWAICVASDFGFPHRTCEFKLIQDLFDAFPPPALSKRKLYEAKNQNILVSGWYIMDKTLYDEGYLHVNRNTATRSPSHPTWFAVDENLIVRPSTPPRERNRSEDHKRRHESSSSCESDDYLAPQPPPPLKRQCRDHHHRNATTWEPDDDFTGIKTDLNSFWNFHDKHRTVPPIALKTDADTAVTLAKQAAAQANAYKTELAIEQRMTELRQTYRKLLAEHRKHMQSKSDMDMSTGFQYRDRLEDVRNDNRRTRSRETTSRAVVV